MSDSPVFVDIYANVSSLSFDDKEYGRPAANAVRQQWTDRELVRFNYIGRHEGKSRFQAIFKEVITC